MNYKAITNVLGKLLIITGTSLLAPIACSLIYGEDDLNSLVATAALTIAAGFPLWKLFRRQKSYLTRFQGSKHSRDPRQRKRVLLGRLLHRPRRPCLPRANI